MPIDYSISPASFTYLSYVDVLAGRIDPAALYDKTVMIGPTALELTDIKAVPVYQALPGVVVQALAAQSLREGALRTTPRWVDLLALTMLTALAAAYFVRNGWRRNLLVGAAAIAVLGALNVYAYSAHRIVLEFVPALLVVGGMFLAATIRSLDQETMRSLAYALGIRRRDALLGSVAESSADAIMVVGPQGQIEMANAAAASMFACSREAMVGALVSRYVPLPDATIVPATLPGKVIEQEATRYDGTRVPGRDHGQPRGRAGRSAAHGDRARHHRAQTAGTAAAVRSDARFADRPAESRRADEPSRGGADAHALPTAASRC